MIKEQKDKVENAIVLLRELYNLTDNCMYHDYSVEGLRNKLNEIETAITAVEEILDDYYYYPRDN